MFVPNLGGKIDTIFGGQTKASPALPWPRLTQGVKPWHLGGLRKLPTTHRGMVPSICPEGWPRAVPMARISACLKASGFVQVEVAFYWTSLKNVEIFPIQLVWKRIWDTTTIFTTLLFFCVCETNVCGKKHPKHNGSDRNILGFQHPNHLSFSSRQSDVADRNHDTWLGRGSSFVDWKLKVEMSIGCQLPHSIFQQKLDT